MPDIYIIAGCNGAGKTTAAYNLLPDVFNTVEFVNADEIARGLSPFNPEGVAFQAGRIMIDRIQQLTTLQKSFALETTLSGLTYFKFITAAKERGYGVVLFFVYLNSIELAVSRVALRVSKGGHNIPENVIARRYSKGLINFSKYATVAHDWYMYDNSEENYKLIAKSISGKIEILKFTLYNKISENGF